MEGLYLYESDVETLGARVRTSGQPLAGMTGSSGISSSGGQSEMDFYWDLKSEVTIEKGTYVILELFFRDPRLAELEYGGKLYPVMVYRKGDTSYSHQTELTLSRAGYVDLWLRYAIVFEGLDAESYFQDYYRPIYESWRENMPW